MEAGVLIDRQGQPLFWHLPRTRTVASLPESPELWDVMWANREDISGFAHSHPGSGMPGPSYTDVTTFAAIEAGLGVRLDWWITSSDSFTLLRWEGPDRLRYTPHPLIARDSRDGEPAQPLLVGEPPWIAELRRHSGQM